MQTIGDKVTHFSEFFRKFAIYFHYMHHHTIDNPEAVRAIRHVTWVGFWVNAVLMALKLIFGYVGHSDALVADGYHSLSDFATDFIVLVFVGLAYRSADTDHPYGHGKFETFASLLIGVSLVFVAFGIGYDGVKSIIGAMSGEELPRPGAIALIVALLSIGGKEALYRYTAAQGRRLNSPSLIANAYHHRSDAISSIATLVGVAGAIFLGDRFRLLDPAASVLIAFFILKSGYDVSRPAIEELLERSLPDDDLKRIVKAIETTPGVMAFHNLRTRRAGHTAIIDLHIKVNPDITVTAGHAIASRVEQAIKVLFDGDAIVNVHVEPYFSPEKSKKQM